MDDSQTILIDNGAYHIKSSLDTQDAPLVTFNAILKDKLSKSKLSVGNQAWSDI